MMLKVKTRLPAPRQCTAFGVAALLVLVQALSAAHFHQSEFEKGLIRGSQMADSLCAICLFHFHSQTNPSRTPSVERPTAVREQVAAASTRPPLARETSHQFSRAPPASLEA